MTAIRRFGALAVLLAIATAEPAIAAGAITKETLKIDRDSRTYYMFVPESVGSDPAPLVITLHGSGRDGRPLVDLFRDVASKERFIVVGPDATDRRGWQVPADGPAFLSGFPVEFHDLPGYEHNTIYSRGDTVVRPAWAFLKAKVLDEDPRYQVYAYAK